MKAVILAAGKGTRMGPLCDNFPKPLLKILDRPLINWNMEAVNDFADGFVIVIGHMGEKIRQHVGDKFKGKPVEYAEQRLQLGTADALRKAKGMVREKFMVLMGDDLYDRECFEKIAKYDNAILGQTVSDPREYGVLRHSGGKLIDIVEKSHSPPTSLANTGAYVFTDKIFDELEDVTSSPRGELELTDAVTSLSRKIGVRCVETKDGWTPIAFPWNLLSANEKKTSQMKGGIDKTAVVEKGAVLKGEVFIGQKAIVKSGSYIEGPVYIGDNCIIGPNCYLRAGAVIGSGCHIGNAVEVKNSIFFGSSNAGHLSYVGDSIIGHGCNLGAGTITANLRFDDTAVKVTIKGERLSSDRRKLGVIMGDNVKTGINVSILPGVSISSGSWINAHELVSRDV